MGVTPSQLDLLSGLLDAASLRHHVIAQNIANVNTPGYRQLEVTFEETLSRELREGGFGSGHRPQARVVEGPGGIERKDGNNVDVDAEMGRLGKNTLLYNAYSQILASRMAAMRSAITGR